MRRLLYDRRGVITVEFALNLAIFVAVFLMAFEVCRVQVASMLLERCVSDIAYQAKIDAGRGFQNTVRRVLGQRNFSLFSVEDLTVTARHAEDFTRLYSGGYSGAGGVGDAVRITLEANLTLFKDLVPEPWQIKRTIKYYYLNERGAE